MSQEDEASLPLAAAAARCYSYTAIPAAEIFRQQLNSDIGRQYRLIAMDLPGHGEPENAASPPADYTIPGYADTAAALLEALQIGHCAVLGWSLGGHIDIEMIAQ